MAQLTNLGRGSKRRVKLVRWTRPEKITLFLMFAVVVIEVVWIALWLMNADLG